MHMNPYRDRARLLRVMAHPMRLEILDIVRRADQCVCHLSAALNRPQPYVSQQLAVLRREGLLADHKEGKNVFYGVADAHALEVLEALFGSATGEGADGRVSVAGCTCPRCGGSASEQGAP